MFQTKEDVLNYLQDQSKFSMKLSLERIIRACELLNNPQLQVKTIHVAGTNGKGSTCNYLSNLLKETGFKVGMYISPYIITFNERIQINGEYISDEDLVKTANQIEPIIEQVEKELNDSMTEFEVVTLLAFVYFMNQDVDYVIYEVGLGGRYDSTNVIKPIVGGITNISYDHIGVLGDTLEKIAYEKIGIAKKDMTVMTTAEKDTVLDVFKDYTKEVHANLNIIDPNLEIKSIHHLDEGTSFSIGNYESDFTIPMLGKHQVKNALLAIRLYEFILKKAKLKVNSSVIQKGLHQSKWGGRLEIISKKPYIMVDGSHNIDGVKQLVETMTYYKDKGYQIHTVFAALKDKDTTNMLKMLESISTSLTLTSFDFYRANSAYNLYQQSSKEHATYHEDYLFVLKERTNQLKDKEILLITGSLYFISEVKKYFENL